MRDPAGRDNSPDSPQNDGSRSSADHALTALLARVGEQLGFRSMSYWTGEPGEAPVCVARWDRRGGGLKAAVERDRYHHLSTEHAQRLVKIAILTGEELWLRDGYGEPGITTGAAAIPVFLEDRLIGAVAALDRPEGQLSDEERAPARQLCLHIAAFESSPPETAAGS